MSLALFFNIDKVYVVISFIIFWQFFISLSLISLEKLKIAYRFYIALLLH